MACAAVAKAFSQNDEKGNNDKLTKRKFKIVDANILLGAEVQQSPRGSFTDFQKLNPQSTLLSANMNGYIASKGYGGMGGPAFGASLGIARLNNENNKSTTEFRVGISFTGINISNSFTKTDTKPYDTLISSQTGQTVYSDSVTSHSYKMNYTSQQVKVDVSAIYRTNKAARWSLYGGIGIEAGETVMAFTDIDYTERRAIKPAYIISSSSGNNNLSQSERFINNNGFQFAAYLPLGIDFRVGAKKEFFKQLHLFYEARPFLSNTNIPELGSITGVGLKMGFGLRVTI